MSYIPVKNIVFQEEYLRTDIDNTYHTTIGDSHILVVWEGIHVAEYYNYIASILIDIVKRRKLCINICILRDYSVKIEFPNNYKSLYINFNYEHTFVKYTNDKYREGKILDKDNNPYRVRLDHVEKLNSADLVIDYSKSNIYNLSESGLYDELVVKMRYIIPCIYETNYLLKEGRYFQLVTSFYNPDLPRRKKLIENIQNAGIIHANISNIFCKEKIKQLYKQIKVLINIHQHDDFLTCEELRVLPALQCGVLVVCEESPLSELIPYNNMIIWSPYEKIVQKTIEVLENYEAYHSKIFSEENVNLLKGLHATNVATLETKIIQSLM